MQRFKRQRNRESYLSIDDAIIQTSFTEGICPDLQNVVRLSESASDISIPPKKDLLQKPVVKSLSASLEAVNVTSQRYSSMSGASSLYSSEPDSLDSPDAVFSHSKVPVLGFFSDRRSSEPNTRPAVRERSGRRRVGFSPSPVIIISSSGEESPANLRKPTRDFGSAGDLLSTQPRPLSDSYKNYLGKSLQQVSLDVCVR